MPKTEFANGVNPFGEFTFTPQPRPRTYAPPRVKVKLPTVYEGRAPQRVIEVLRGNDWLRLNDIRLHLDVSNKRAGNICTSLHARGVLIRRGTARLYEYAISRRYL